MPSCVLENHRSVILTPHPTHTASS
ncbi:hypothetical protein E2C01_069764 [Portunus trituberculatus]|uniref:Uncharacterized protein n=1 Tax=Portunus trituberculatus TaxID=210409 RepID=A0A5B7I0F8_PORTR|nr:hypothetical protein [Portunus trituberculatus]